MQRRASAAGQYAVNRLNQYSNRTVAGAVDVLGVANPTADVTVNANKANRHGEYFHWPLAVNNSSALYTNISVISLYGSKETNTGYVRVPPSTERFAHDADGNLARDGLWTNTWDAENRLVQMESVSGYPDVGQRKLQFTYDSQGRRIRKVVWKRNEINPLIWNQASDERFVYDGWNLIAILNSSFSLLHSFTWGLDLSGSLQGAGGVGGLLIIGDGASGIGHFSAYDGNGNVIGLTSATNGASVARYEYGPFAEPLRTTGWMANRSPFRFSTKYHDDDTDLLYYGYRYYSASTGRWLNRDPLDEKAGRHVYAANRNSCVLGYDGDGRLSILEGAFTKTPCGGWQGSWLYQTENHDFPFFIVQAVTKLEVFSFSCDRPPLTYTETGYEAREFGAGSVQVIDHDVHEGHREESKGFHSINVVAKVFAAMLFPEIRDWPTDNPNAPGMHYTRNPPAWWNLGLELEGGCRSTGRAWSCCCPNRFEGEIGH